MQTAKCLTCSSDIIVDDEAVIGDLADCLVCGAQHEITSLTPLSLSLLSAGDPAPDDGEFEEEDAGNANEEEE